MAEWLMIFTPGERFATMGQNGQARIYTIGFDGQVVVADPVPDRPQPAYGEPTQVLPPHSESLRE